MFECKECDWEGTWPSWAQREVEELQSFYEVPYCPECGSYDIEDHSYDTSNQTVTQERE